MQARVPTPGDIVAGRFRVEAEIGRGGMGAVLRARDPANAAVAIKVLLPEAVESPDAIPRFLNEARASRELTSEHTTRVFDAGTLESGLPFMVMELLDGVDLQTMMDQRGPLAVPDVCDAVIEACDALAEAHARGMVHRDLKPANLFVAKRPDGSLCTKVLDFGLSKLAAQARHVALTSTGAFLGSPHYMAPEQLKSAKGVDARADIWSLGVVMYELVTGKLPFDGGSFGQLFMEIVSQEPKPVTALRPDLPPGLVEIVERCMKKDREQRYADVATLASALARFASPKGAAAARRIGERGAPRPPAVSEPDIATGAASPAARPPGQGKLGGTMLMANAPQFAPSSDRMRAAPPAHLPAPSPPVFAAHAPAPPTMQPAQAGPPAPAPPGAHPTAAPRASSPAKVFAVVAAVVLFLGIAVTGVVLAMSRLRDR